MIMTAEHSGPAYRIVTERIVIRCWDPADVYMYQDAMKESIEHLSEFLPWAAGYTPSFQIDLDRLRSFRGKFDLGQDFVYGIFNREETRVLGGTGLHTRLGKDAREIGYWIHKDFTGIGFASEASAALTKVAFEVDQVERVEIHCAVENLRSAAVPKKLGYTLDGTLRQRSLLLDGLRHDTMIWSLLRAEYPRTPCIDARIEAYDAAGSRLI
jgi:RimJ/RimL family protein N-acetyltransferase